jgi:hypothetical protein
MAMKQASFVLLTVIVLGLTRTQRAIADIAPPVPAPGTTIEGGESTTVQMISEDVLITLQDDTSAAIVATFDLKNQGTETESFDVRFPIGMDSGDGEVATVADFDASVDDKPAEVTVVHEGCMCAAETEIPWAHWPVTFAPGQTVTVTVSYRIESNHLGDSGGPFGRYQYILRTGAGSYGPIGVGRVTFRVPYEVSAYTVPLEDYTPEPNGYAIYNQEVVWEFSDLEPTEGDDIDIIALDPRVWRNIEVARAEAEEHPDSLDAHLALAHSYQDALHFESGLTDIGQSQQVAGWAMESYERAIELAPNSVDVQVEYVQFLFDLTVVPTPETEASIKFQPALEHALALDPTNETLLEIQAYVEEWPEDFVPKTPIPTRVPRPTPTHRPTTELVVTQVAEVEPTDQAATAQPAPASSPGCALGGIMMLLPLGAVVWNRRRLLR